MVATIFVRRMRRPNVLPLYIGGFLGPFGAAVLSVLIPQLRDAFGVSTAAVAAAVPAYLVPFALLQLVSGTIGERAGRRRVVRAGYLVYAAASLAAAAAPTIGLFLGARALQGTANAFLTPLVLAGLAEVAPAGRMGRTVGTFAAVQTAAFALSPLLGGVLGELHWRLVFVVPALVAVGLAFLPPPDAAAREEPARLRAAFTPRVGLLSAASFAGYAGITGLGFLVALRAADDFGLGSSERGLLLAAFGVAGVLAGRPSGRAVDRFGRVPVAAAGALGCAVGVAALGPAGSAPVLAALWFAVGVGSNVMWAGLNTLMVEAVPANRAGATSFVSGFKFAGAAAAPVMWLPLYDVDPRLAFAGAALAAAGVAVLAWPLRSPP